ncbi:hypothetical protein ACX9I7_22265 [Streptomyces sp. L500]
MQRRIGLGLACAALIALAVVLWQNGGDRNGAASLWISVVSAVVSVCAFAADLLRGPDGGHAQPPRGWRQRAADALAEAVGEQWAREAQRRRLQDPAPLDVGWSRLGPPLADHRENVLRGRSLPAPRDGEQVATAHTTLTAMLKGFAGGFLRGFAVCTLIGVSAATVVGGITGLCAAHEFRWAPRIPEGRTVDGWHLEKAPYGVRTATSTAPYRGELLFGRPGETPLAVPRHARIARDWHRSEPFEREIRIRMEREGPVLTASGLPRADAWNVVLKLPRRAQLWLTERSALVIVRDAMLPLLAFGALAGLIGGCASGVYRALSTPSDTMRAAGPRSTLRTDRAATLARSATAVVLAGGICWTMVLLVGRSSPVGTMHMELWVPVGTSALALSAWGRLGIARVWLALTGRAPWRLMGFLAEAHRRGVLRQSGAHYEFRHLRLQQRLSGTPDTPGTPRVPTPSP